MTVTRDENGHLQPDYNYRRPSDNPDARELEKYRYGERPSRSEYPDQSSYAAPSRGGVDRTRAMAQYATPYNPAPQPESFANYEEGGVYYPEYIEAQNRYRVAAPDAVPFMENRMARAKGFAGPYEDNWQYYEGDSAVGGGVVPVDDVADRIPENGWHYNPKREGDERAWTYIARQDQRLPRQDSMDKLQSLYEKAMGYIR